MDVYFLFFAFLCAGLSVLYGVKRSAHVYRQKVKTTFEGRSHLSPAEFHVQYFAQKGVSKDVVVGVLDVLEVFCDFGAYFSALRPDDGFDKELAFVFEADDMADVEIVVSLEDEFSIKITDQEATDMKTVRDIIMCVWNKV